ncbi:hypothetical protein ACFX1X_020434 [Malus domestica]
MANRVIPATSKFLKIIRPFTSASFTTISAITTNWLHLKSTTPTTTNTNANNVIFSLSSFDDVDKPFASVSTSRLLRAVLRGMLVYALEYVGDNEAYDRNLQVFLDTAESIKSLPPSPSFHH